MPMPPRAISSRTIWPGNWKSPFEGALGEGGSISSPSTSDSDLHVQAGQSPSSRPPLSTAPQARHRVGPSVASDELFNSRLPGSPASRGPFVTSQELRTSGFGARAKFTAFVQQHLLQVCHLGVDFVRGGDGLRHFFTYQQAKVAAKPMQL